MKNSKKYPDMTELFKCMEERKQRVRPAAEREQDAERRKDFAAFGAKVQN